MTVPTQRGAIPALKTRKLTGKPPWPIILLAGAPKAGKTYAAVEASACEQIGATYLLGVGEDAPDEYKLIPGSDVDLLIHDGTFKGMLGQLKAASLAPRVGGKPTLLIVDSFGRVWDLLAQMAQAEANQRAAAKAAKYNRPVGEDDVPIGMDLWNVAKDRWQQMLQVLRDHDGPSIVTARLEKTTVMNDKGEPTKEKDWKIKAEKGLDGDVGVIVELPARGEAYLSGVRSFKFKAGQARTPYPGFSVVNLWRDMGVLEAGSTAPRDHVASLPDRTEHLATINQIAVLAERIGRTRDEIKAEWAASHDGQYIGDATDLGGLELLRDDLKVLADRQGASVDSVDAQVARELAERRQAAGVPS